MTQINENSLDTPANYSWKGLDVLIIFVGIALFFVCVILFFGVFSAISIIRSREISADLLQNTIYLSIGSAFLESAAIIGSVYLLGLRRKKYPWASVGVNQTSQKWFLISLLLGLLAIPLSSLVAIGIQYLFNLPIENPQLPYLIPDDLSTAGMFIMIILVGIVVPFAEELFFRGILYQWLRTRFGVWVGIIVSSLIFGIFHFDIAIAGAAFILGVLLAWVFERSNSLWPSVLIHSLNNAFKVILLYGMLLLGSSPINF